MEYRDYYITPEDYEIAERNGICESTLRSRILQQGWSKERAITTKVRQKVDYGKWLQVSKENGINKNAFMQRVTGLGWSMERAATTPMMTKEEIGRVPKKNSRYPRELVELAKNNGIGYATFAYRVGVLRWSLEKAATTPVRKLKNSKRIAL